jgi:hypothetical protein
VAALGVLAWHLGYRAAAEAVVARQRRHRSYGQEQLRLDEALSPEWRGGVLIQLRAAGDERPFGSYP